MSCICTFKIFNLNKIFIHRNEISEESLAEQFKLLDSLLQVDVIQKRIQDSIKREDALLFRWLALIMLRKAYRILLACKNEVNDGGRIAQLMQMKHEVISIGPNCYSVRHAISLVEWALTNYDVQYSWMFDPDTRDEEDIIVLTKGRKADDGFKMIRNNSDGEESTLNDDCVEPRILYDLDGVTPSYDENEISINQLH